MINLDSLPVNNEFAVPKPGMYVAKVAKAEVKAGKVVDGVQKQDSLSVVFDLLDASGKKTGTVFESFYDSDKQFLQYLIGRFIKACGIPLSGSMTLQDIGKLVVGKTIGMDVTNREWGEPKKVSACVNATDKEAYYTLEEFYEVVKKIDGVVADNSFMNIPDGLAEEVPFEEKKATY